MRILEVLDTYYPKFDGPTMVITNYCKSLNKIENVKAEVCVPHFPDYVDDQPFGVFRTTSVKGLEGYYFPTPDCDVKLKKFLDENKFDVIHCHSPFTMCKYFIKYAKKNDIPIIYTFHTKFKEDFDRVLKLNLSKKIVMNYIMKNINSVDKVLTVSNGAADCLREYGYNGEIDVIRNGTDLIYPENADELLAAVKSKYNFDEDCKVFLSVCRVVENKKLDFAVKKKKKLFDSGVKFKYFIVGEGPYLDAIKEKVRALGLEDVVLFTGKVIDRHELSSYYLMADLFIFPSTFDTASLSPIEAAALKLPSILTEGCSSAEIITDGVNGLLAKEDVDAWCEKIISALGGDKLKVLSKNAYEQVYKTWDEIALEIYSYYQKVLENKNK